MAGLQMGEAGALVSGSGVASKCTLLSSLPSGVVGWLRERLFREHRILALSQGQLLF